MGHEGPRRGTRIRLQERGLGNLLHGIRIVPEGDHLVAEVGLQGLELRPYIGLVAGVRFGTLEIVLNLAA
jgi:hypothetical protein